MTDTMSETSGDHRNHQITGNVAVALAAEKLNDEVCVLRERICDLYKLQEALTHVIVECGVRPGIDSPCRCEYCREVAVKMDEAGYLDRIRDRWWEEMPHSSVQDTQHCPIRAQDGSGD